MKTVLARPVVTTQPWWRRGMTALTRPWRRLRNVLWVTSFNEELCAASGRDLIESFVASGSAGRLLCCYEGGAATQQAIRQAGGESILEYCLDDDACLRDWLASNREVIPVHLGGTHLGCACPGGPLPPHDQRHHNPCVGAWFVRNASRWFRKIASIHHVLNQTWAQSLDVLLWIDADCNFQQRVANRQIYDWFDGDRAGVFYFRNTRPVLESGIVGFNFRRGGQDFLRQLVAYFLSGHFRSQPRWDDCWAIQTLMERNPTMHCIDLAQAVGDHAAVVPHSPVGPFIAHDKGRHGRKLGLMT